MFKKEDWELETRYSFRGYKNKYNQCWIEESTYLGRCKQHSENKLVSAPNQYLIEVSLKNDLLNNFRFPINVELKRTATETLIEILTVTVMYLNEIFDLEVSINDISISSLVKLN